MNFSKLAPKAENVTGKLFFGSDTVPEMILTVKSKGCLSELRSGSGVMAATRGFLGLSVISLFLFLHVVFCIYYERNCSTLVKG